MKTIVNSWNEWVPLKDVILKNVSKNDTLKKISKFISNQGLSI